jgi:hypothetical protein
MSDSSEQGESAELEISPVNKDKAEGGAQNGLSRFWSRTSAVALVKPAIIKLASIILWRLEPRFSISPSKLTAAKPSFAAIFVNDNSMTFHFGLG